jgi:tetratricopeptide (TPR) repeat protein
MNTRTLTIIAMLLLAAAIAGTVWRLRPAPPPLESVAAASQPLPVPPLPPRIAEGHDYDECLDMLDSDPAGAATFAEAWRGRGGGDGATHCLALSRIAIGQPEDGAAMLESLAADSHADPAARASIDAQAGQAWLMAGENARAYRAASAALALVADDADLLLDRANIAEAMDRPADALADLDRALAVDPERTDAMVLRATAQRHLGHLDAALADVSRALARDPENAEALLERGILRQRRGDAAGARADWQHILDLDPDSPAADLAEQNLALLDAGPDRK